MPKYLLTVDAEFESAKPLSRDVRRKIVKDLQNLYAKSQALEGDISDSFPIGTGPKQVAKTTRIAFDPIE